MRRGWAIAAAILVVLLTVGIAVGAYNAGLDEGIRRAADSDQVVQVVGGYGHGYGFFPFGFFLFPLFIIGTIFLVGRAFRGPRGPWGHDHGHGYGPWSEEGRARFEDKAGDWHRRQHEQASGGEETTGPPAG
ncbi:MAG TPA: hypothetical protein VJZ98_08260 [Actinomycetota bacterium]|nr:hypothetical protein [Actinomycetota bacterium]